ncbi:MAG: S41 family peptidase [Phycisphaerales bacterium]
MPHNLLHAPVRWLTLGALLLAGLAPVGCSTTTSTDSTSTKAREQTRTISEAEALADFDAAWQLVYDTHFDTTFNGVDWEGVRDELRPAAADAHNRNELRMILQDMLSRLNQSHFGIIPADAAEPDQHAGADSSHENTDSGETTVSSTDAVVPNGDGDGDAEPGIDLRLIDGQAVVSSVRADSPADLAGVKTGWVLKKVRDVEVAGLIDRLRETLSENELRIYSVRVINDRLQGSEGSTIALTFLNGVDGEVPMELERVAAPGEYVKFGNLPPLSTHLEWSRESFTTETGDEVQVGIIKFNIFMIPIAPKFERAMYELRDCDGIIIDLRGNPGGVGALSSSISRFIMSEKGSLGTMKMRGAELSFNVEPVVVTTWGEPLKPFTGPVAIVQDAGSASTSEVFAGGLQSLGRVKVFGTRSAGMALPAAMDKLPSGDVLLHAIADFVTTTGARMEHDGVIPDVEVKQTREALLKGIDAPEQAAKDWIASESSAR